MFYTIVDRQKGDRNGIIEGKPALISRKREKSSRESTAHLRAHRDDQ